MDQDQQQQQQQGSNYNDVLNNLAGGLQNQAVSGLGKKAILAVGWPVWATLGAIVIHIVIIIVIAGGPSNASETSTQTPSSQALSGLFNVSVATNQDIQNIQNTMSEALSYPLYKKLAISAGPINIDLDPTPVEIDNTKGCGGEVKGDHVTVSGLSFCDFNNQKYILMHEIGHIIRNRNIPLFQIFQGNFSYFKSMDSACYNDAKGYLISYRYDVTSGLDGGPEDESFADAIALFLTYQSRPKLSNFPSQCPYTYNWIRVNIFQGGGIQ